MSFSFRVKHGNKTWVNDGKLATTVQQINFAHEPVNRFSKRSINAKTKNSGKSLQQNYLESLISTSATSTSQKPGCVDGPPRWNIGSNACGCPFPIINSYSCGLQSYSVNYIPGDDDYTITVYYTRCNGNQTGGYNASAQSHNYKTSQYPINSNCIINQKIACSPCNGVNSCPASKCINTN